MDANNWITLIGAVLLSIPGISGLIIALRKTPIEIKTAKATEENTDADTAKKYQELADREAARRLEQEKRIEGLEKELKEVKDQMVAMVQENARWRDWCERLVHQVKSMGAEPVPMVQTVGRKPAKEA